MPLYATIMMTIHLIPVGATDFSAKGELLGLNNPDLSDSGRLDSSRIADGLQSTVFEAVFSGPMRREIQTAEIIAGSHSIPVRIDRDLRDVNYGRWSGRTWQRIESEFSADFMKFKRAPQKFRFPYGEKIKKGGKRTQHFAWHLLNNYGTGEIAIIVDDFVAMMLASQIAKVLLSDLEPWSPSFGKITEIACDRGSCKIEQLRGSIF